MFVRELRTPVVLVFGAAPEPEITGDLELDLFVFVHVFLIPSYDEGVLRNTVLS